MPQAPTRRRRNSPAALDLLVRETQGYPYFLQEWGKHVWDIAPASPIRTDDVQQATREVIAALDESFFRVRFDRLTPSEKRYLRAMAELGPGPHRSGDIAQVLHKKTRRLPAWLLRGALSILKPLGLTQYGPEQLDFLRYRPVLLNTRLKTVFGYTPTYTSAQVLELYHRARSQQAKTV